MNVDEFSGVTLGIGVVRGVRSFDVDKFGRLTGVNYKTAWKPGENEAQCLASPYEAVITAVANTYYSLNITTVNGSKGTPPKVTLPTVTTAVPKPSTKPPHSLDACSCGFYAYYDGSNDYRTDARIAAVVEGYGDTLIGTRGFRASKARIAALCIPGRRARFRFHWLSLIWLILAAIFAVCAGIDLAARDAGGLVEAALSVAYIGMAVFCAWRQGAGKGPGREAPLTAEQVTKVRRNYPDIPVYTSFAAMVAAYPPDKSLEPAPDTDPKFWER